MGDILGTLGIDFRFILLMAVGFLLLFMLLKRFAFGPIFNVLEQRQSTIRNNLDEAAARRNEMVRLQKDYEQRLATIEDEARDKIQAAVKDAQAARDEIIARANADRDAIMKRTEEDILRERDKATAIMRDQIAEMAVTGASRILRQKLDVPNQGRLIDEVISEIGSRSNAPRPASEISASGMAPSELSPSAPVTTTKTGEFTQTVIRVDSGNGGLS